MKKHSGQEAIMMLDNKFLQIFLVKMKEKRLQPLQQLVLEFPVPKNPPNEASTAVENSLTAFEYDDATSSHTQCARKRPAWMQDYEVTGIGDSKDPPFHFAPFSDCDPTNFEVAIKEQKWQQTMDVEIVAIERNNTWE